MRSWTEREYRMRLTWLDEQWNHPSRADNYLMQIAAEIRRGNSRHPERIQPEQLRMKFVFDAEPKKKLTPEESAQRSKTVWRARLSGSKPRA